jgi:hypothetical protein
MNFLELKTALRSRIGNPSVGDVTDASLGTHVNDAYQEIFDKYKFKRRRARAKFSTVIGADKYVINTLTDVIFKVWDRTNGRELTKVGSNVLAERDYDGALVRNGRPEQWDYKETYLQLLPPPDGAYAIELYFKAFFCALVADNDVPLIPSSWHRGIYILAAHLYYDDEAGDSTKAMYHLMKFKDWVSDKPVEEHEETEAIDSGVEVPTLAAQRSSSRRPDGVAWDLLP